MCLPSRMMMTLCLRMATEMTETMVYPRETHAQSQTHASGSMEPAATIRIAGSHIWLPSSKMALAVQRLVRTS